MVCTVNAIQSKRGHRFRAQLYSFVQRSHIIRATGALHSTGASIIRATSGSGSSACCAVLLRFRPRFPLPFMAFSGVLFGFPRSRLGPLNIVV
jgi:hypothetical protein